MWKVTHNTSEYFQVIQIGIISFQFMAHRHNSIMCGFIIIIIIIIILNIVNTVNMIVM